MENELVFIKLPFHERAEVIYSMVESIAIETGYPIQICIALIAEYKKCSCRRIEEYIKEHDPTLLYQIAFYIGERKVYKSQLDEHTKHILLKYLQKPILEHPFDVPTIWLRKTIQDFFLEIDWNDIIENQKNNKCFVKEVKKEIVDSVVNFNLGELYE